MKNKALIVIDLQNDITKNCKKIIGQERGLNKRLSLRNLGDEEQWIEQAEN